MPTITPNVGFDDQGGQPHTALDGGPQLTFDEAACARAMEAMYGMKKLDLAALPAAFDDDGG